MLFASPGLTWCLEPDLGCLGAASLLRGLLGDAHGRSCGFCRLGKGVLLVSRISNRQVGLSIARAPPSTGSRGQESGGMALGFSSCCSGEGQKCELISLLPTRGFRSSHGSAKEIPRPSSSSRPFWYPGHHHASFPVYGDWQVEAIPSEAHLW